ncbi:hypothetical protein [Nonomuraea harbinensis]|uniref:Uncharacterized protein n=1 Tax=Nonomuraea harbinensis TaxID=1286938 RepID=A0ABW1BZC7_9ACTN|nr:hypothetical protein [Nonomuraea harbinensis]
MTDTPWEPPLAGDESAHLLGALDRLRTTFRWKADGLDEESPAPAPRSPPRWPTAVSTSSPTSPPPTDGTRACAAWSAT